MQRIALFSSLLLLAACAESLDDPTFEPTTGDQSMVAPPAETAPGLQAFAPGEVALSAADLTYDGATVLTPADAITVVEEQPRLADVARAPRDVSFGAVGMRVHTVDGRIAVSSVLDDMPAADAGIESGMFVVAVDGMSTADMGVASFVQLVRGEPGTSVELTVEGELGVETVVISRETLEFEQNHCQRVQELRQQTEFGGIGARLRGCDGVHVVSVEAGSPAERAGLQAGDRIVGVDGLNAEGAQVWDVISEVRGEPGETVVLDVTGDDGALRTLEIERVSFVLPEGGGCGR